MTKSIVKIGLLFIFFLSFVSAASIRNQVLLMQASENIRLDSQEISKNYLYFYSNPKKIHYKKMAESGLADLDKQFRLIAKTTKDEDSKDVLAFLDYTKERIEDVLRDPFDKDNPSLMLDYSEILLEGAESINRNIDYTPSKEEKMMMDMKDISFLVERMTKYYMAILIGGDGINYAEMLNQSIEEMERDLSLLEEYKYSPENLSHLVKLRGNWIVLKKFYLNNKKLKAPNIVLLASLEVRKNARVLEIYHSKNQ
ncbi:MAG: hypothetical protein U9R27_00210 [Campylobacterota bacterium]|nr:hypothetical protein [Campylobacterota bacterium]